jgi:hypothetical protein
MNVAPRRLAAIALAIVLVAGVGFGIISSVSSNLSRGSVVALHGLIGSEKLPFFQDTRVIAALQRGGFDVTVATAGSRQIASMDLTKEAFVFPAGVPAAEKIRRDHAGTTSFVEFYTPMAIASWKPIVDLLTQAGLVHQRTGYLAFDMAAFMDLVGKETRWKDLPGNTAYPVNKSILVTTTDVRRSNSAAMYLALTSYVANGDNIVENAQQANTVIPKVSPLFLRQGFVENSSEVPFDDYLVQGMGKSPMVLIYESQYLQRAASGDGAITPQMALMYPEPTILSKHTLVSLTADGARLGQFLLSDPGIRALATEYGFRTTDTAGFHQFVTTHQLAVPDDLIDVIDPPTYESLETMITQIEGLYSGTEPVPTPSGDEAP